MKGLELSALDTLQHRLPGHAESHGGLEHRQIVWRRLFDETCADLVGETNTPGCTGRQLFARDEAVIQPPMNRARHDVEDSRRLPNRHQVAGRWIGGRLEPRNIPVAAQASDLVGGETFAGRGLTSLLIQDAGDDLVGVMSGEAGKERDGLFIRPNTSGIRTW